MTTSEDEDTSTPSAGNAQRLNPRPDPPEHDAAAVLNRARLESAHDLRSALAAFIASRETNYNPRWSYPELDELLDRWSATGKANVEVLQLTQRLAVLAWEVTRCSETSERFGTGDKRLLYIVKIAGTLRGDKWPSDDPELTVDRLRVNLQRGKRGPRPSPLSLAAKAYGVLAEGARVSVSDSNLRRGPLKLLLEQAEVRRSVPD